MFYLKKSFGKWILKQNRKIIYKGTLIECFGELVKISKNKKNPKNLLTKQK